MDYEDIVKKMFYDWDSERKILDKIQKCQRNWDHKRWNQNSDNLESVMLDELLYIAQNSPSKQHEGYYDIYYSDDNEKGKMSNMDSITNEIKIMMGISTEEVNEPPKRFGAKDVTDLSWKNILEAYSCSECGRCTSVCPANITGKKLSPRKIMMDVRDRSEEIGKMKDKGLNHNDKLLDKYKEYYEGEDEQK